MATATRITYVCVVDGKTYDPDKATAEFRGLCSMRCQHQLARECGYRDGRPGTPASEYHALSEELRRRRQSVRGADWDPVYRRRE